MKKFLLSLLAVVMMTGCGASTSSKDTVAGKVEAAFNATTKETAGDICDELSTNAVFEDIGMMVVEEVPGFLNGFDGEITGFEEGYRFCPMIMTMPFVGYVFKVDNDKDGFMKQLKDNANLRWNICTEADEMVCTAKGDFVLFVMAPTSFDE